MSKVQEVGIDVENASEWIEFVNRTRDTDGLIVADVFSGWAEATKCMVSAIRKIWVDFDVSQYPVWFLRVNATAVELDALSHGPESRIAVHPDLEFLREKFGDGKSLPLFLFIRGGRLVADFRGCNIPQLYSSFESEIVSIRANKERDIAMSQQQESEGSSIYSDDVGSTT